MIIMVRTRIGIRILKTMKIKIVLIRLILLRRSSSNKVKKNIGRDFYIKGFISDMFFHQTWVTKMNFFDNLL